MAFGKRREPDSYGVPVRSSAPAVTAPPVSYQPQNAAPSPAWAPAQAAAPAAEFYSPPAPAPMPAGAQFAPGASAYPPAPTMPGYAPPATQFGAPPAYSPPPQSNLIRNIAIGIGVGVVVLILAAVAIPSVLANRKPVDAPATLGGYSELHNESVNAQIDVMRKQLQDHVPGRGMVVSAYGDADGTPRVILAGIRMSPDERSKFMRDGQAGIQDAVQGVNAQSFGDVLCMKVGQLQMAACIWEAKVSGIVMMIGSADLAGAAVVAEEARDALNKD